MQAFLRRRFPAHPGSALGVCVCRLSGTLFAFDIKTHKTLKLPHSVDVTRVSSLSGVATASIIICALRLPTRLLWWFVAFSSSCLLHMKRERHLQRESKQHNMREWTPSNDRRRVQCKQRRHTRLKLTTLKWEEREKKSERICWRCSLRLFSP